LIIETGEILKYLVEEKILPLITSKYLLPNPSEIAEKTFKP
jgi:hypothetical protein